MSANDFLAQSTPQSIGATSIPSSEAFSNQSVKFINKLYPTAISTSQSFLTPSIFLSRTIYPKSIYSSQYITNNHLINGIQPSIRYIQQYSISSQEIFSVDISFALTPTPPSVIAAGFIKSWVSVANSMLVNITKKNILDVDTLIEYQKIIQPHSNFSIESYIKSNIIEVDFNEKYLAISYLDFEKIDMARQINDNLESYIKQKYQIESYFVSENIQMPKVTRYKIEKY